MIYGRNTLNLNAATICAALEEHLKKAMPNVPGLKVVSVREESSGHHTFGAANGFVVEVDGAPVPTADRPA